MAHHYRRSPNTEKAITYLHLAGQQAVQRSANPEAISHLTTALDLLFTRPETPERAAQELTLRLALGPPLAATQGYTVPEVARHYARTQALCAQLGDTPQRFPVLWGLWLFHLVRGDLRTAQALAEECLRIAEQMNEDGLLVEAHFAVGVTFLHRGEFVRARGALEQSVALYQTRHQALTPLYGNINPKVLSLGHAAIALWSLGYPEQALTRSHEALHLAQELGHPFSLVFAFTFAAWFHPERGEGPSPKSALTRWWRWRASTGFPITWHGAHHRGEALIAQAQWVEGITQVQQGLEAKEGELRRTIPLAWLAVGYGGAGQIDNGLAAVAEGLRLVDKNDERLYEAELYRLRGELTLQQGTGDWGLGVGSTSSQAPSLKPQVPGVVQEVEECFLKAIDIAQHQQAKSWELRATTSLARLWQQQGKTAEARELLAPVYNWFTEGFETKDLQGAQVLLEELSR